MSDMGNRSAEVRGAKASEKIQRPPRSHSATPPAQGQRGAGAGRGRARPPGEHDEAPSPRGSSPSTAPRGAARSARSRKEKEGGVRELGSDTTGRVAAASGQGDSDAVLSENGKGAARGGTASAQRGKGARGGTASAQRGKGARGGTASAESGKGARGGTASAQRGKGARGGTASAQRGKGARGGTASAQRGKGAGNRTDSAQKGKGVAGGGTDSAQRGKGAGDGTDSAQSGKGAAGGGTDSAQRGTGANCKESALKESQPERCSGVQRGLLRAVLNTLVLSQHDISEASACVNKLMDRLVPLIQTQETAFSSMEKLGTGSYYEHVKISAPNEFDIMLKIPAPRVELKECESFGAFFNVEFKRNPARNNLDKFLSEEGTLAAWKMLSALRKIIKNFVKSASGTEMKVTLDKKKAGSPAITLRIGTLQKEISVDIILALEIRSISWPASTQDGLKIEKWLGTKVKQDYKWKPIYLVPKHAKDGTVLKEDTWRISFSHIEKDMIKRHGNTKTCCESGGVKCCRKDCLKLLKHLLDRLKTKHEKRRGMEKFYSYHAKTAFFHACVLWPDDKEWQLTDLESCFHKFLDYFLDFLNKAHLPHFFIPTYNLFSLIDKASIDFLSKEIKYEINNRFPIFELQN